VHPGFLSSDADGGGSVVRVSIGAGRRRFVHPDRGVAVGF